MYGKIFLSMYEGSMVGSGPTVFAVWGYCIAKADPDDHTVLLNPALLSGIIGTTPVEIETAINKLCSPDARSKNPDHEGRRLIHQSGFCYFVVSHEHYRNIKNMSDVREYERLRKQEYRKKLNVPECPGQSGTPASASASGQEGVAGEDQSSQGYRVVSVDDGVSVLTKAIMSARPEFSRMHQQSIENTIRSYPPKHKKIIIKAINDFIVAAVNMIECPRNPIGLLKGYINKALSREAPDA